MIIYIIILRLIVKTEFHFVKYVYDEYNNEYNEDDEEDTIRCSFRILYSVDSKR